jgi:hypothetical protein
MKTPRNVVVPLRLDPSIHHKITQAANLTGLAQSDIMRLAIAAGLADLEKVGFDLGTLISSAASSSAPGKPTLVASTPTRTKRPLSQAK